MPRRWQYPARAEPIKPPPSPPPLIWLPQGPDFFKRPPSPAHITEGGYVRVPAAVSPLSWQPVGPDYFQRKPSMAHVTEGGYVRVPAAVPPLTWHYIDPVYPDRSRRLTAAVIDTTSGAGLAPSPVSPPSTGGQETVYAAMEGIAPFGTFAHAADGQRGFGVRSGHITGAGSANTQHWVFHDPLIADQAQIGPEFVVDVRRKS